MSTLPKSLFLLLPSLALAACTPAEPVSGEATIGEVAEEFGTIECTCATTIRVSNTQGSEDGCNLSSAQVGVESVFRVEDQGDEDPENDAAFCDTVATQQACIDPSLTGDEATLPEYCDTVCEAVGAGLTAVYGCDSTSEQVPPDGDFQLRQNSSCLDECSEESCNDCAGLEGLPLLGCYSDCNATAEADLDRNEDGIVDCTVPETGPSCIVGVDPPEVEWVDHSGAVLGGVIGYESRGPVQSSSIGVLEIDGIEVDLDVDGSASVIGPPCPGESCTSAVRVDLEIEDFVLPFPLLPFSASTITLGGTSEIHAINLDASGEGSIPAGSFVGVARFDAYLPLVVDETQAFEVTNAEPIDVSVDWTGGSFTVEGSLSGTVSDDLGVDHSFTFDFGLDALLGATGPTMEDPGLPARMQCNAPDGALLAVEAAGTDLAQGSGFTVRWWNEPDIFSAAPVLEAESGDLPLAMGDNDVTVMVSNGGGRAIFHRDTVNVYDLQIAEMVDTYAHSGGFCLVPTAKESTPQGFGTMELLPLFEDDCDSAPKVAVGKVEPASSKATAVLRERDGELCLEGGDSVDWSEAETTYKVFLTATDASGNEAEETVMVTLAKDSESCKLPTLSSEGQSLKLKSCSDKG